MQTQKSVFFVEDLIVRKIIEQPKLIWILGLIFIPLFQFQSCMHLADAIIVVFFCMKACIESLVSNMHLHTNSLYGLHCWDDNPSNTALIYHLRMMIHAFVAFGDMQSHQVQGLGKRRLPSGYYHDIYSKRGKVQNSYSNMIKI